MNYEEQQTTEEPVQVQVEQPEAESWHQQAEPEDRKSNAGSTIAKLGAAGVVLFKLKTVILLMLGKLKFLWFGLKYLKFTKLLTTLGSMILVIWIDATRWGWKFAVGFVLLLLIHEMGHMLALRRHGLKCSAPIFIPGFGALIAMREMPRDAKMEAEVGIAGPLLGSAGAFLCLQFGGPGKWELFTRLAYLGFFLNLFNLLPVLPLDGGRVMAAISPKVWIVGLVGAVLLFLWSHNPILLILVILSIGRTWHAIKGHKEDAEYYNVPKKTRLQMTAAYFGLAAVLAFMMMELHQVA